MSVNEIVRLQGKVIWLDLTTGDKVDEGTIQRAILRPEGLAMDIRSSFGDYSIQLSRSGQQQQEFKGTWECATPKGREHGVADCSLDPKPEYYLMSGVWAHGKCHWFARLEPVEQFSPQEGR